MEFCVNLVRDWAGFEVYCGCDYSVITLEALHLQILPVTFCVYGAGSFASGFSQHLLPAWP